MLQITSDDVARKFFIQEGVDTKIMTVVLAKAICKDYTCGDLHDYSTSNFQRMNIIH